ERRGRSRRGDHRGGAAATGHLLRARGRRPPGPGRAAGTTRRVVAGGPAGVERRRARAGAGGGPPAVAAGALSVVSRGVCDRLPATGSVAPAVVLARDLLWRRPARDDLCGP